MKGLGSEHGLTVPDLAAKATFSGGTSATRQSKKRPSSKGVIMADCQVTCITKPHVNSSHEQFTHLGNPAGNWVWPREDVIRSIENKSNNFFVIDPVNGKRAEIQVVRDAGKAPYV